MSNVKDEDLRKYDEIWLSDGNSIIFFSKQEVDDYINSTLNDDGRPTEYSAGGFRKVKLSKKFIKSEIIQMSGDKLLNAIEYDPTRNN